MNTYPVPPSGISTEPIDGITISTANDGVIPISETIGNFEGSVEISTDFTQRSEFDVILEKLEHSLEHSHALEAKIDALSAKLDNIFKFD
tara:strand:- start:209 stop:478 length:270 start_codon:yes stop_codon:yes gene_type:complete